MGGVGVKVVVPVRGLAWLVAGTALGCSLLGPWLQEMQDRARGYRWNYRDRCIADEVSQLVLCLTDSPLPGIFCWRLLPASAELLQLRDGGPGGGILPGGDDGGALYPAVSQTH